MNIINKIAEVKIRLGRGTGLVTEIKNAIYVGAGLSIIFKLSPTQGVISTILALIGFYVIGSLDLNYFKLAQEESKLNAGKYNPYFIEKLGNIKTEKFK